MSRSKKKLQGGDGWSLVRACPACGEAEIRCRCREPLPPPEARPAVRLRLEKRHGRPVTVLATSGLADGARRELLKELKATCASGGTIKGRELEIQGDHRPRIRDLLGSKDIRVKG